MTEIALTFPVSLRIGGVTLHPHWVFETLAYGVGLYGCYHGRTRLQDVIPARARWTLVAAALAGGFVGSRLLPRGRDGVGAELARPSERSKDRSDAVA